MSTRTMESKKGTIYVLNSMIIPLATDVESAVVHLQKVPAEEVSMLLHEHPFVSAVGHDATAQLLSTLLDVDISMNRIQVSAKPGDVLILFRLHSRLPEGTVIRQKHQLDQIGYDLYIARIYE